MPSSVLHLGIEAVTGLLYFTVAALILRRATPPRLKSARDAFALWWLVLGTLSAISIAMRAWGTVASPVYGNLLAITILLLITGGSAALVYYQTVLLGLVRSPGLTVGFYYAIVFTSYLIIVLSAGPQYDQQFGRLVYSETWIAPGGALHPSLTITYFWTLLGPGLVGAGLMLWRSDRIADKEVRDRAMTVGGALFVWYLFVLVGSVSLLSGKIPAWLTITARTVNLLAIATVLIAMFAALRRPGTDKADTWIDTLLLPRQKGGDIRRKVLIVDDEEPILESLRLVFDEFCTVPTDVTTATSGEEGLEKLRSSERFDLILADYRMGNVSGADVLEKAYHECPDAVRVLITGYAEDQVVEDAVQRAHVHAYVLKPWDTEELVRKTEAWLGQGVPTEAGHDEVLRFLERSRSLV